MFRFHGAISILHANLVYSSFPQFLSPVRKDEAANLCPFVKVLAYNGNYTAIANGSIAVVMNKVSGIHYDFLPKKDELGG